MTNATYANSQQVLCQGTDDHILDGQPIGSCLSELQAWTNVNGTELEQVQAGTTPATSASPGEEPDLTPPEPGNEASSLLIPASELTAAATRLRPDPAISKALKRLLDGGWTYQDEEELVIRFEPRSKVRGKKPPRSYTTTRDSCTCPGAIIRGGCYHPIAWQIVSEARVPTTSIECTLPSTRFIPLCLLALSGGTGHVILSADTGRGSFTLIVPNIATGTLTVEMTTPVLLTIEQQVCTTDLRRIVDALASALSSEDEQVMLELTIGSMLVIAGAEDAPVFVDGLDTLPLDEAHNGTA